MGRPIMSSKQKGFGSFEIPTKANRAMTLEIRLGRSIDAITYGNLFLAYKICLGIYSLIYDSIRDIEKPAKPPSDCVKPSGWHKQEKQRNQSRANEEYEEYLLEWCHKVTNIMYKEDMIIQYRGQGMKMGSG